MVRPAILCVDDERMILVSLKDQLRRHFPEHVVEIAESGELALELLDELLDEGVDVPVIVSDHIMPGMHGDELLARVQERSPETVKVMLTGQASAEAVGSALNKADLFRYIAKPWQETDLAMTVRAAIESRRKAQALAEQQETLRELSRLAIDLTSRLAARDRHRRLIEGLAAALRVERAALFGLDGERLRRLAAFGARADDTPRRLPVAGRVGETLRGKGVLRCDAGPDDLADDLGWADLRGGVLALGLASDGEPTGLLAVGTSDPAVLRAATDARFAAFGGLAAASLHTGMLLDALEKASDQQRMVAGALLSEADQRSTGPLLGRSPAVRRVVLALEKPATPDQAWLILGPPGSGREAAARHVHRVEQRPGPFILLVGASVTDAAQLGDATRSGPFTLAANGTLYVAAVDRMSLETQARLAELSTRSPTVRLVLSPGGNPTPAGLDDLLHPALRERIGTPVVMPALRDRRRDIPTLAEFYLRAHATRHGRPAARFSEDALRSLIRYSWPGQVRELDRVVERAVLIGEDEVLDLDDAAFDGSPRVGAYRLTEPLAAGAMGEVWKAEHDHLARPAAVKLIKPDPAWASERRNLAMARFRREATATAALRSPHTVQLYDFGVTDEGDQYYVMELLEGLTVRDLVLLHGALPPARVVHFLRQVCHSLMEAHEAGLVHRDIKPANLMVGRVGPDPDVLKVLDFGIVFTPTPDEAALTAPGTIQGTPATMAPEALQGREVDPRSDLYSLGCTAYYMLRGRHVFTSKLPALLFDHVKRAPEPLPGWVPESLAQLVLQLLAKSPSRRPRSARALRRELDGLVEQMPWTDEDADAWWGEHHPELRDSQNARREGRSSGAALPAAARVPATVVDHRDG